MTAKDCKRYDGCSAPICPMDEGSKGEGIWYCDEEFCRSQAFSDLLWIRNQRKISKKCRDTDGFFNLKMLSQNCQIKGGIKGIDPDREDVTEEEQTERWLIKHPVKREVTEEEREIMRKRLINYRQGLIPTKKNAQSEEIQDFNTSV